jgi:hypothetical protein
MERVSASPGTQERAPSVESQIDHMKITPGLGSSVQRSYYNGAILFTSIGHEGEVACADFFAFRAGSVVNPWFSLRALGLGCEVLILRSRVFFDQSALAHSAIKR